MPRQSPGPPNTDPLDPRTAELLARLVVAVRLGDGRATARIIAQLSETERGAWLIRQFSAAGLRLAADEFAQD